MTPVRVVILIGVCILSACGKPTPTQTPPVPTHTSTPLVISSVTPTFTPENIYYVDGTRGSDSQSGSLDQPWQTIQQVVEVAKAGDLIYVRGGEYEGIKNGWHFENSGTASQPITLTNYPGEQAVFKMLATEPNDRPIFTCSINPQNPPDWQTPKADHIRIIGTDVTPRRLTSGVESQKGIVMQGMEGEQSAGIVASDCDHWEVAGVDFIETSSGIFTLKNNWGGVEEHSTDHWYVHDNRVYNYYRESGMQFNGDENVIENNEIYKVSDELYTPFGCQMLNILGDYNVIRGNILSRLNSQADCSGILFEWDLADMNIVEGNHIFDVFSGINLQGGDNNLIQNNVIHANKNSTAQGWGIGIFSYDDMVGWPCDEENGPPQALLPPNDPAHPDYQYYFTPRNCLSYGNQVYNNTIHGFADGIRIYPLIAENTIIRNNALSGWTRPNGSICHYNASNGTCPPLSAELIADHNVSEGDFGFADLRNFDFHLMENSPLINAGFNLGLLNGYDFEGILRPQGAEYDIGAYEFPQP